MLSVPLEGLKPDDAGQLIVKAPASETAVVLAVPVRLAVSEPVPGSGMPWIWFMQPSSVPRSCIDCALEVVVRPGFELRVPVKEVQDWTGLKPRAEAGPAPAPRAVAARAAAATPAPRRPATVRRVRAVKEVVMVCPLEGGQPGCWRASNVLPGPPPSRGCAHVGPEVVATPPDGGASTTREWCWQVLGCDAGRGRLHG